jgi:hypothetical protein
MTPTHSALGSAVLHLLDLVGPLMVFCQDIVMLYIPLPGTPLEAAGLQVRTVSPLALEPRQRR